MLIEAHLKQPKESLQVPVPPGFRGERTNIDDQSIHVSSIPCYYTADEIKLIEDFMPRLQYPQSLTKTGAKQIGDDSLLAANADDLDALERIEELGTSKYLADNTPRPLFDRILIIRENGYQGIFKPTPPTPASPAPARLNAAPANGASKSIPATSEAK